MTVHSASSLVRHCRHAKVLQAQRPPHPAMVAAAEEGSVFHGLAQGWIEGRLPPKTDSEIADMGEPWRWFEYLRATWTPPLGVVCEAPLGLAHDGGYVRVAEWLPHQYEPVDQADKPRLMTAGRADVAWVTRRKIYGRIAVVADWKRSSWRYGSPESHPQLMALGLAWAAREECEYLQLGLYDARDAAWEWSHTITLGEERERMLQEVRAMATLDNEPHPGEWCAGCYERRNCKSAQVAP